MCESEFLEITLKRIKRFIYKKNVREVHILEIN